MCPLVGYNNPNNIFTVVDLPDPFGPSNPNTSPRCTSKSTLSTARAFGRPQKSLKTLVSPRTATTTSADRVASPFGDSEEGVMISADATLMPISVSVARRRQAIHLESSEPAPA